MPISNRTRAMGRRPLLSATSRWATTLAFVCILALVPSPSWIHPSGSSYAPVSALSFSIPNAPSRSPRDSHRHFSQHWSGSVSRSRCKSFDRNGASPGNLPLAPPSRSSSVLSAMSHSGTMAAATTGSSTMLRGKLHSIITKLFLSPANLYAVAKQVIASVHVIECVLIAAWMFLPVHIARWVFCQRMRWRQIIRRRLAKRTTAGDSPSATATAQDRDAVDTKAEMEALFQASKSHRCAIFFSKLGRLQAFLYILDLVLLDVKLLGFDFFSKYPIEQWTAAIVVSLWFARNLSVAKWNVIINESSQEAASDEKAIRASIRTMRTFLNNQTSALSRQAKRSGSAEAFDETQVEQLGYSKRLVNMIIDVFIYGAAVAVIVDFLPCSMGLALRSLYGLSGVGTLVFSWASRDLASQMLASLAIEASKLFDEGDELVLHDGTQGVVHKMGLLRTHIRREDETIVRIPNSQIATNRISNISRTRLCQVKQSIVVKQDGLDNAKIEALLEDIRNNVRERTGKVLIDNKRIRPLRVRWSEYKGASIEIVVDAHFRHRPSGSGYWDLRETVLKAIMDATQKNGVKF